MASTDNFVHPSVITVFNCASIATSSLGPPYYVKSRKSSMNKAKISHLALMKAGRAAIVAADDWAVVLPATARRRVEASQSF